MLLFSHQVISNSLRPMDCSIPGFPVRHQLPELIKRMSIESVMPSNHLILCYPLLLLPSIFPSIRVFSKESALWIRWPKYWSFSFSIGSSNEYSGLISFRIAQLIYLLTYCRTSWFFQVLAISKKYAINIGVQIFLVNPSVQLLWVNTRECVWWII